jgi:hypothetical protein
VEQIASFCAWRTLLVKEALELEALSEKVRAWLSRFRTRDSVGHAAEDL